MKIIILLHLLAAVGYAVAARRGVTIIFVAALFLHAATLAVNHITHPASAGGGGGGAVVVYVFFRRGRVAVDKAGYISASFVAVCVVGRNSPLVF